MRTIIIFQYCFNPIFLLKPIKTEYNRGNHKSKGLKSVICILQKEPGLGSRLVFFPAPTDPKTPGSGSPAMKRTNQAREKNPKRKKIGSTLKLIFLFYLFIIHALVDEWKFMHFYTFLFQQISIFRNEE